MKWTQCLTAALCAALAATSASAAIVTSMTANSTTGIAGITSWPTPFTNSSTGLTTPANDPSDYAQPENNYGGASLFSLAQSWTATTSGKLTDVQITITGTAPVSFNVALYESATGLDTGGSSYTPGSGGVSNNLFADTAVQTWNGFTVQGASAGVLDFALSGADQVNIVAGNRYVFEISSTTNPNGMIWFRNAVDAIAYPGGQAFRQRAGLNGNGNRDLAMAVNVVPEPSCLALASLGALALLRRRK
jgi:PEP-CTERM motif